MSQIHARRISASDVIPLRHQVLREGKPRESAIFAGDELPTTTHWGAFSSAAQDARTLAVATLMRSPMPGESAMAWQVRGMASAPEARGKGFGAAVLQAVMDYVASQEPGALLWCNARVGAMGFYLAQGFVSVGPEFEIAGVGPHYVMWRRI